MGIIKSNKLIGLTELEGIVEQVSRAELYAMGIRIIREYFYQLSPHDQETYVKGHRLRFTGRGFNVKMLFINDVAHAPYIESGRTPGKRPPLENILGWVRRHGIGEVYGLSSRKLVPGRHRRTGRFLSGEATLDQIQLRVAKKIAAKIARFGQRGHFLYRDMYKYNKQIVDETTLRIQEKVMVLLDA